MLTGSMTALVTPFKNGKVDEQTFAELIQRQISKGIEIVVPAGTTGESATLTQNEHKACIEIAIDVCKDHAKVLAGAGSNNTLESIKLAKFAQKKGAQGVLSVAPYYNKPTQKGLYEHYKAIAQAIDIELICYNVPGRTSSDLLPATFLQLANDFENINSIKEATADVVRTVNILSKNPDLGVISGVDQVNQSILSSGGNGVISVTSNLLPDKIVQLVKLCQNNNTHEACALSQNLFELNEMLYTESNPIMIKAAMFEAGLMPVLELRLPLTKPEDKNLQKLKEVLKKYKIKGV